MYHKLNTAVRVLTENGFKGLLKTIIKKIFPDGNVILSWNSRILLKSRILNDKNTANEYSLEDSNYKSAKLLCSEEVDLLGENGQTEQTIKSAKSRQENCWIIKVDSNLVSYVWISDAKSQISSDTGYIFPIQNKKGYWWRDAFVNEKYRGQGVLKIHYNSWLSSIRNLENAIYTEVSPENSASIIAHARLGFVEFSRLRMLCVFGFRMFYITGGPEPGISFLFNPSSTYS